MIHTLRFQSILATLFVTPLLSTALVGSAVAAPSERGSLLIYSKVEIKWDNSGQIIQDTALEFRNEHVAYPVDVQVYYVNGDLPLDELCTGSPCNQIIRVAEPGWNTADCRFVLGRSQTVHWLAAAGGGPCQPFTVVDEDGPGRSDPETNFDTRVLRGFVVMFAVAFNEDSVVDPNGQFEEIRWNYLAGDASIIDYANAAVWSYEPWAFRVLNVLHGEFSGTPGFLNLNGVEYESAYSSLSFSFTASGEIEDGFGGIPALVDTDLTLHPVPVDLRQDNDGPVTTKAEIYVTNEFGSRFSGTRRCITCWDERLLSVYTSRGIPNHFLRQNLGTDYGVAEVRGVASNECNNLPPFFKLSESAALLGIAAELVTFDFGGFPRTSINGANLTGVGSKSAVIQYDAAGGSGDLHLDADEGSLPKETSRSGRRDLHRGKK